jgi:glycosyltransferase involved in cell wall biosynthesis
VFGNCPPEKVADLQGEQIILHGYVDDLCAALSPCTLFLCPLQSGTGIKTKIVEALMLGLPVATTLIGAQGLDLVHGENCYIWQTPGDLVEILKHMQATPERVAEVARAGQEYARNRFSPQALERRWSEVLDGLPQSTRSPTGAESPPKQLRLNSLIAAISSAAWKRVLRTITTTVDSP